MNRTEALKKALKLATLIESAEMRLTKILTAIKIDLAQTKATQKVVAARKPKKKRAKIPSAPKIAHSTKVSSSTSATWHQKLAKRARDWYPKH